MRIARRPSPFGELLSLRTAMDRLFEDRVVRPGRWVGGLDGAIGLALGVRAAAYGLVVEAALQETAAAGQS